MSVKIRLRRMGTRGKPFYRIVVADSRTARDGRFIEALGYYDPRTDPPTIKIDEEKALLWLNRGAQPSDTAEALLKKKSIFQKFLAAKGGKVEKPSAEAEAVPAEAVPAVEEPEPVQAPTRRRRTKAAVEEPEPEPAEAPKRPRTPSKQPSPPTEGATAGDEAAPAPKRRTRAAAKKPEAVAEDTQAAAEPKAAAEEQPSEEQG